MTTRSETMRGIALSRHGGPEVLERRHDLPRPAPAPGEVRVRVEATGLNQVDNVIRQGYPGIPVTLPHVLGGDIVGSVDALGEGVSGVDIGQRVMVYPLVADGRCRLCRDGAPNLCVNWEYFGLHRPGGYAEYAVAPAANLVTLPDDVAAEQAVCLPVAGLTAYHALGNVAGLRSGQTLLIWGGSGALGTLAIQIAKQLGATVIATGGSAAKLDVMRELGADMVLNRHEDDVRAEVAGRFPDGLDVVLDYVGPQTFPTSFELLKKGGTLLLCGILTGRETQLSIHQTYLKHLSIRGLYLGTMEELRELLDWMAQGRVRPRLAQILDLDRAVQAHEMLLAGQHAGKIVLKV